RQGIHLRGYAQKDPKQEYKRESFAMFAAMLESLKYEVISTLSQNRAMLNTLNVGPTLDPRFQTYRYLRTPEEPVKRDSPRRAFL
ncbi:hypothetical protein MJO10_30820, partial [Salmonella enterica subsp. enterica serovar Anatum]|nr:hypothetical protein [Salmonella enterica subsp. enterica serovar Anatum]